MSSLINTLSLMVSYQCNVACRHCGPHCGPEERDWMTNEELLDLCKQAGKLGAILAVFTGGEPTLLKSSLVDLFRSIKSDTSIQIVRMVTNGKWAVTYDIAKAKLLEWKEAGLDEINISCGEFHQEWIPIESVVNAYKAAVDLDFTSVVLAGEFLNEMSGKMSPTDFEELIGKRTYSTYTRSQFSTKFKGLNCGAVMPYGRGKKHITEEQTVKIDEEHIGSLCADVNSVITAHPNGNVTACCGVMVREDSLLTIGNWRTTSLDEILKVSKDDIILNWIKYVGLRNMKSWLLLKDPTLNFKKKYSSICDLCADILYNPKCQKILVESAHEKHDEVLLNKIAHESTHFSSSYKYS